MVFKKSVCSLDFSWKIRWFGDHLFYLPYHHEIEYFFNMLFSYIMHVSIPFWPCIKLMLICWLVIPHFDGSYYVYQHLVHPGLSMDPQVVMNRRFNESKKLYHSRENFLVAADRYIKENGAEALKKLLARKVCHYK